MHCQKCSHEFQATDVRCINCGATLIYEANGHSKEYKEAASFLDSKIFAGMGALIGFSIVAFLLRFVFTSHWLSDRAVFMAAMCGGLIGGVLGRLIQKRQQ